MTRPGRQHPLPRLTLLVGLGVLAGWLTLGAEPPGAFAQGIQGLQSGGDPLEINADDGIEWRRNEQLYIARGNARAARGDITVFADVLTAHYNKDAAGKSDIDRIDMDSNVRIVSPSETVYGDRGAYDVINGILVLVGDDLRLESGQDLITARDSLEYWENKNMAVARGEAVATREDKRILADVLTAHFKPGPDEKLQLHRIDAYGNVRISTATEYARGDRGVYYLDREFATLTGGVRITREENQMNGEYAEVDMKTGISRLLAGPPGSKSTARVHGLLVPKRKPKTENDS